MNGTQKPISILTNALLLSGVHTSAIKGKVLPRIWFEGFNCSAQYHMNRITDKLN